MHQTTLQELKQQWSNNELAIMNRNDKATFESLILLCDDKLPFIYYVEEKEKDVEVYKPSDLRKLDCEYLFGDGDSMLSETATYLEPKEFLKLTLNDNPPSSPMINQA